MIHFANALLAYEDCSAARDVRALLISNKYNVPMLPNGEDALNEARRSSPDLVLIGPRLGDMDPLTLARKLKNDPDTRDIPVCLLAAARTEATMLEALEIGLDDIILSPSEDATLLRRLQPLVRLATMHGELARRSYVASGFGVQSPSALLPEQIDEGGKKQVIAVLTDPADRTLLETQLGAAVELTVTDNPFIAQDMITDQNFDAAVIFVGEDIDPVLDLCTQVRNNPRLFNLPVVLVADEAQAADQEAIYRRGASRVVLRPVDKTLLRTSVLSLVRRQRLRWAIRQAIDTTKASAVLDELTGLYNRAFMDAYLKDRLAHAAITQKTVSVVVFSVPALLTVGQQFGDEARQHLVQQLGHWITRLLRAEDPTALYSAKEFLVALPDTPLEEAQIVAQRIAGVLTYTDFAVEDVYEVVKVWPEVGVTAYEPGDTYLSVIERARANLS